MGTKQKRHPGNYNPGTSSLGATFLSCRMILMRFVSRIVPPKDIEDIVQETYIKACDIEQRDSVKQPRSLFFKIAKNLALDHIKRAEFKLSTSMEGDEFDRIVAEQQESDDTYHQVALKEEFSMFCESVRYLPVQCRRAFVLKKVYGFSQKEIAQYMDISQSTVEKHIANGIKRCTVFMMNNSQLEEPESRANSSKHKSGDFK